MVHGFADDLIRDAADGDLCFRVCPRYLRLREVLDALTLLEDGYATSRTLEQATEPATVPSSGATGADSDGASETIPQSHLSKVMSPEEAGTLFGCTAKTFAKWFAAGKIRGKKITSKAYQIHVDDLPQVDRR